MKEIKATAVTWSDVKRLSDENERLTKRLKLAESCLISGGEYRYYIKELTLESETND